MTPDLVQALRAARDGRPMPKGINRKVWIQATNWVLEGSEKRVNIDYAKAERPDGKPFYIELVDGKAPKVPQTHGWLIYLMYRDFGTPPTKQTPFLTMCTPYMYNKYGCIFGLTGSVGGHAERDYIEKTFSAVPYQVPLFLTTVTPGRYAWPSGAALPHAAAMKPPSSRRVTATHQVPLFLTTCRGAGKVPARNRGVLVEPSQEGMIRKVVELVLASYRDVPVLVITQGKLGDELDKVRRSGHRIGHVTVM